MIKQYARCQCGAITLFDDKTTYSVKETNLSKFCPDIDLSQLKELPTSYMCNHCINKYGLDLCACGSGKPYETCDEGYEICGKPMQKIDEYSSVKNPNGWGVITDTDITINDLLTAEHKIQQAINDIRNKIQKQIQETPDENVKPINNNSHFFTINFSHIVNNNFILSAEYYDPDSQANHVHEYLSTCKTISEMTEKINKMIQEKTIKSKSETFRLHPNTIKILEQVIKQQEI